jgi:flagellar hook assembly protein FlgD
MQIKVYNITGQEIKKQVNHWKTIGIHQVWWDGRDAKNMIVPSGIYLLRVSSDKFNQTRKIILMK